VAGAEAPAEAAFGAGCCARGGRATAAAERARAWGMLAAAEDVGTFSCCSGGLLSASRLHWLQRTALWLFLANAATCRIQNLETRLQTVAALSDAGASNFRQCSAAHDPCDPATGVTSGVLAQAALMSRKS
jgi:hypothetical protein